MACDMCWAVPQPPKKHSYLVHLLDAETARWGKCIIQSECAHGMQEWVEYLASTGQLRVNDNEGEEFLMSHPKVMHIDPKAAAHVPVVDPVN